MTVAAATTRASLRPDSAQRLHQGGARAAPSVLSTLNEDGSRKWMCPRPSPGRFQTRRRVVAWALIILFTALPYISIDGKPAILLDILHRRFTFFGVTFLPTDTLLLALFMLSVFVTVFLATALFGRVWCGWACPQTVYMEFVYRPIERLFEGTPGKRTPRDAAGARKIAKYAAYLLISMFLAHTFLAYFVGVEQLFTWVRGSPINHPVAFIVMAVVTMLMLFDFGFFREQTCIVACPYGRLQSVMLDRHSLIISYDERRGEPRGKKRRTDAGDVSLPQLGDCIDCFKCVTTCPTGIDIRNGLQMECIGCAQCIDACDDVMDRIGRPRGLIRYSTQAAMEGDRPRLVRPRVIAYPALLAALVTLFGVVLAGKAPADVTVLRGIGLPYVILNSGEVSNEVRIKIVNRTDAEVEYTVRIEAPAGARFAQPEGPILMRVGAGAAETQSARVAVPRDAFTGGECPATITVEGGGAAERIEYRLLGPIGPPPQRAEHKERERDDDEPQ